MKKAKKTFEDAIERFPKDAPSILNYSELLIALSKFDDARKSIEKNIDIFSSMKDKQNMQVMKITLVMIIEGFYNNRDCVDSSCYKLPMHQFSEDLMRS
jgi:tetratricopeptide (TPR) repeat protein